MATTDARSGGARPSVSIGVPVYNGEAFLEEALASIAAQTRADYEVIISDNASTDRTPDICEAFAAKCPGARYVRSPVNIGGDRNYYRTFELARGDFFLGLAHDDRLHPDYLRRTVAVLEADPSVVFCHSRAYEIDANGAVVRTFEARPFSESPRPYARFRDAIDQRPVIANLGVIRVSVLKQLPPLMPYPASDAYWQAELALHGKLVEVPEVLFYRRVHADSGQAIPLHERIRWSDPSKAGAIVFPSWRRAGEYTKSVFRAPLQASERLRCLVEVGRFVRSPKRFVRDVKVALKTLLGRTRPGVRLLSVWSRSHRH
jgi:glycosyltransferase involved in cell wall biosynthesis